MAIPPTPTRPAQGIPPKPTTAAPSPVAPKPNPLHGAPTLPEHETTEATRMQLDIHGQPPRSNMAPPPPDEPDVADGTRAEMEAGKKALATNRARHDAELDAGKKAIARLNPHSQSKDEDE